MSRLTRRNLIAAGLASGVVLALPAAAAAQDDPQIVNVVRPEGYCQGFRFSNTSQVPGTVTFKWADQERSWFVDAGVILTLREGMPAVEALTISRSAQLGLDFYTYDDSSLIYCNYGAEPGQPLTFERKELGLTTPMPLRWVEDQDPDLVELDSLFLFNAGGDREASVSVASGPHHIGTYVVPPESYQTIRFDGWEPLYQDRVVNPLRLVAALKIGYHESEYLTYRAWGRDAQGTTRIFTNRQPSTTFATGED